MKINLGCGDRKFEGFVNVDKVQTDATDLVYDLTQFPWPFEDNSADEVHMVHFFEHVPAKLRGKFMDEIFRILKVGGICAIQIPSYNSTRYYQDFTHEWPPLVPGSFYYFNKSWRETNRLTHGDYAMVCDFDASYGYNLTEETKQRAIEAQKFAAEHYWNATTDLIVNLTKRG